ncbi:hypothetical protein BDZ90DRAFT_228987 [Jaminaea rosea]|uniref:Long chronological lifespan protein 2 n=1 Tax=Jaminaea rosea TaxID=1569628 RepID=A0A316V058_9BASI|nr:hypothetical protein BDZ90DRAFT_228987 [Jaminaea rosea]PWN29941.1 hypothetical protein BDZ90DRAFT_228987 [Jaminaea rosea]
MTPTLLIACLALLCAAAQAQFFNFFGGQHQQHHGEQEPPPSGDASWFEARVDASTCPTYLCPRTLSCVPHPSRCPCPFKQQIRCPFPDPITGKLDDGGAFCVNEDEGCEKVLMARGLWWEGRKLDEGLMKAFA